MAVTLTTLLPPTRSGRTLFVASSVLGAFALLQMSLLCWHLLRSNGQRPSAAPSIRFAETAEPSTSSFDVPSARNPPASDANTSSALTLAPESAPLPTPAAPGIDRPTPAPAEGTAVASLIGQARRLRQNGDVTNALAELRQAQLDDPSSPQVIAELGITYEAMQLTDRAFEQWQRLYNMGEGIGALYYLADEKLHNGPATAPAPGTGLMGPSAQPPPDSSGPGTNAAGFQDNAMLKITDINAEDDDDPAVGKKVSLKIVVKSRPGSVIDPKKVQIETYFYDSLDGKVVQTNAQTGHAWLTTPVTWANDQSEVLETTYFRPKMAAAPAPALAPAQTPDDAARGAKHGHKAKGQAAEAAPSAEPAPTPMRAYLGYTVRLYYDRQLQEVKADPLRLLQQFPPPLTLPED